MLTMLTQISMSKRCALMSEREIRFARKGEETKIMDFLREHWDPEFSVVQSRELFDFLYEGEEGPRFAVALDQDRIVALLGFTIYDRVARDVFLMLWRSIDTVGTTGLDLIRFMQQQDFRSISSVGVRPDVLIIYKLLGFQTGSLEQWVKVNHALNSYKILKPSYSYIPSHDEPSLGTSGEISEVREFDQEFEYFREQETRSPFKSIDYLTKRYLQHPNYCYRIFEYHIDGEIANYFVTRTVEYNGATALRLIDCIANDVGFAAFSNYINVLFDVERHEYIDVYCLNIRTETLENAGFRNCALVKEQIVPNYFEPFVQEAEVKYYITNMDRPCLYKGDGDADRPYRLA